MTATTSGQPASARWDAIRIIGIVLAIAGLLDAGYLSGVDILNATPALCSEGGSCDIVQNSAYAEIGGVSIAIFGLAGYLVILLTLLLDRRLGDWGPIILLGTTLIGTLYSAYLTYLELFVLHAICQYCVASAVFMLGLLIVAIVRLRRSWQVVE